MNKIIKNKQKLKSIIFNINGVNKSGKEYVFTKLKLNKYMSYFIYRCAKREHMSMSNLLEKIIDTGIKELIAKDSYKAING